MSRREFMIAVVFGLVVGAGVTMALGGSSIFTLGRSKEAVDVGVTTYTAEPLNGSTAPSCVWFTGDPKTGSRRGAAK